MAASVVVASSEIPLVELRHPDEVPGIVRGLRGQVAWVQPLDPIDVAEGDWASSIATMFDGLRSSDVAAVPVVTIDETAATYGAVREIHARDQRGAVLLVAGLDAMVMPALALSNAILACLDDCGVTPESCDLVVDLRGLDHDRASAAANRRLALDVLPRTDRWRSIVLVQDARRGGVRTTVILRSARRAGRPTVGLRLPSS